MQSSRQPSWRHRRLFPVIQETNATMPSTVDGGAASLRSRGQQHAYTPAAAASFHPRPRPPPTKDRQETITVRRIWHQRWSNVVGESFVLGPGSDDAPRSLNRRRLS